MENLDNPIRNPNKKKTIPKEFFDDRMGRMPPNSRELEEAVLGAMMLEREKIFQVIDILSKEHFYDPKNQIVFEAIDHLYKLGDTAIDLLTVSNYLKNYKLLDMAGGYMYLAQLTNKVTSAANIEFHARILTQKFIQRSLIRVAGEIQFNAYDDTEDSFELLDLSEAKLYEIKNAGLKRNYQEISTLITNSLKDIEARMNSENNGITGVASGFSDIDRINGGWQPSDLVILAARPAMGKTAFALSLVRNAAIDHKKSVMVFSLEMADIQLVNRLISSEAQVSGDKIKKSSLNEEEWIRLQNQTIVLGNAKIYIDDTPQLNIFDLNAKCRRIASQQGLDMVVVDYLQLLRADIKSQGNREQEIAFISRSLKALAKDLNIPVIALAQLSREVEKRSNKRPQLSDLRESGSIEQDADMVMFLYRHEYYEKMGMDNDNQSSGDSLDADIKGLTEVIIAKNRHGTVGSAFCKFIGEFSKFQDLDHFERDMIRQKNPEYGYTPDTTVQTKVMPSKMNSAGDIYDKPGSASPFDDGPSSRPDMKSWGGINPPSTGFFPPNVTED
jgi:replicative DNA helicase